MAKRTASIDGKMRRTIKPEIRLTDEEDTTLDQMHDEFNSSIGESVTLEDFVAILVRRQIAEERAMSQAAMDRHGLR